MLVRILKQAIPKIPKGQVEGFSVKVLKNLIPKGKSNTLQIKGTIAKIAKEWFNKKKDQIKITLEEAPGGWIKRILYFIAIIIELFIIKTGINVLRYMVRRFWPVLITGGVTKLSLAADNQGIVDLFSYKIEIPKFLKEYGIFVKQGWINLTKKEEGLFKVPDMETQPQEKLYYLQDLINKIIQETVNSVVYILDHPWAVVSSLIIIASIGAYLKVSAWVILIKESTTIEGTVHYLVALGKNTIYFIINNITGTIYLAITKTSSLIVYYLTTNPLYTGLLPFYSSWSKYLIENFHVAGTWYVENIAGWIDTSLSLLNYINIPLTVVRGWGSGFTLNTLGNWSLNLHSTLKGSKKDISLKDSPLKDIPIENLVEKDEFVGKAISLKDTALVEQGSTSTLGYVPPKEAGLCEEDTEFKEGSMIAETKVTETLVPETEVPEIHESEAHAIQETGGSQQDAQEPILPEIEIPEQDFPNLPENILLDMANITLSGRPNWRNNYKWSNNSRDKRNSIVTPKNK